MTTVSTSAKQRLEDTILHWLAKAPTDPHDIPVRGICRFVASQDWRTVLEESPVTVNGLHVVQLVRREHGASVLLLGVERGGSIPIHDHGPTRGASLVLDGAIIDVRYRTSGDAITRFIDKQSFNRHTNGYCGDVDSKLIHAVGNWDGPAMTAIVEAYSPHLDFTVYNREGETLSPIQTIEF